jgi:hypothetical protein
MAWAGAGCAVAAATVALLACAAPRPGPAEQGDIPMAADEEFAKVEWGSGRPNACTPKVERKLEGIRIAAPQVVVFDPGRRDAGGGFAPVILCGVYRFSALFMQEHGNFPKRGTVVAVNVETHAVHAAEMSRGHPEIPPPNPPRTYTAEELEGQFQMGYFNENPLHYLDVPEGPGTYQLYVTFGPYTSNVVTVTLRTREEAARNK